jgi:hypothetical protein
MAVNQKANRTWGLLLLVPVLFCLLTASVFCGFGNLATYYVLRKPVMIRDPAQIDTEMERISLEVRLLRGISSAEPVQHTMITPEQLREETVADFKAGYSEAQAKDDLAEYVAFGVLAPEIDLYKMYLDVYSTGILGFYDPPSKQLYVVSGSGFGASERTTFAHEYMHALQYQRFDISALGWNDTVAKEDSERAAGIQALVEGEATMVETLWQGQAFSIGDWIDYYKQQLSQLNAAIFSIPDFLRESIYFPYYQGLPFVMALREEGGWAAIDAAYRNPPVSTEMILHPEKYRVGDQPMLVVRPRLPDGFTETWREFNENTMGEFAISSILGTVMDSSQAKNAAAGWGGDRYLALANDSTGKTVIVWHTEWDTPADAADFDRQWKEYNIIRFGDGFPSQDAHCWVLLGSRQETACQRRVDQGVWWFYGPDRTVVEDLMAANSPIGSNTFVNVSLSPYTGLRLSNFQ